MKSNIRIFMSFMFVFVILTYVVSVPIAKGEALDVKSKLAELEKEIIEAAINGDDDKVIALSNERKVFHNIDMKLDQLFDEIAKAAKNRDVDTLIVLSIKRKEIKQLLEKDGINKVSSKACFKDHNKVVQDNMDFGGATDGGVAY